MEKDNGLSSAIEEATANKITVKRCKACRGIRQDTGGTRCKHCRGSGIEPTAAKGFAGDIDRVDVKK